MCNARIQNFVKESKEIEKASNRNSAIKMKCHRQVQLQAKHSRREN